MLKGFGNILLKELKELIRDPKILVGMIVLPLVMFPVLGLVFGYAQETAKQQATDVHVLVVNNDGGNWSRFFIDYLGTGLDLTVVNNISPSQVVSEGMLGNLNLTTFLEIPVGFSDNMTVHVNQNRSVTSTVNSFSVYQGGSVFGGIGSSVVSSYVEGFNRFISPNVVRSSVSTIIRNEIEHGVDPTQLSGLVLSQTIALPVTIMILLTYAMQIAATSVAMEKEEKTLETLLTLPVDRFAILMGKLCSTIIVAGAAAAAIMFGYNIMLGGITGVVQGGAQIDLVRLGLVPSLLGYVLLGFSVFVALLYALALAVVVSAFCEDVRGAQALVGYVYPVIFIPALAMIYLDINTLPAVVKGVLYAIPFSHPVIASKAVVLGDYVTPALGIVYVALFTLVIMFVASRMFATERILTAKLGFRKGRRKNVKYED